MPILRPGGGEPLDFLNTRPQTIYTPDAASFTIARSDAAQTFTGVQTFTSPVLTTPAITGGTITGATIISPIYDASTFARCTVQFDATSGTTGTTLTNVVGMSLTVGAAKTYYFCVRLPGVATANSGLKVAFKYTTATIAALEASSRGTTASAVVCQHTTTTTDQTSLYAATNAVLYTTIEGIITTTLGGTIQVQAAQNASHSDTTSVYVNASFELRELGS